MNVNEEEGMVPTQQKAWRLVAQNQFPLPTKGDQIPPPFPVCRCAKWCITISQTKIYKSGTIQLLIYIEQAPIWNIKVLIETRVTVFYCSSLSSPFSVRLSARPHKTPPRTREQIRNINYPQHLASDTCYS